MLKFLNDKFDCTGCGACLNICPKDCIKMVKDDEGFCYPVVNQETCINCGRCEKVCPSVNKVNNENANFQQKACAALSLDDGVWAKSSSGGAFTEICKVFEADDDLFIFGCENENGFIHHSFVKNSNNISKFRRSKYVQSEIGFTFKEVKKLLNNGNKVVFTGLPCQIAGLRNYLGNKNYPSLLLVDLICHGVGSPSIFSEHLLYLKNKYKASNINYEFRNKIKYFKTLKQYISKYTLNNGERVLYKERDEYNLLFLNQVCLRPCCSMHCKYRSVERMGDLTIADFKCFKNVFGKEENKNYSTIITNTPKGEKVLELLKNRMEILPCSLEDIKKYNPLFCSSTPPNPLRDSFFFDYKTGVPYLQLVEKYTHKSVLSYRDWLKNIVKKLFFKKIYI